jgi:hypothetical protein
MLRRLMSWCVPDSALELKVVEAEVADVELALAPYEHEAAPADSRLKLRVVTNS